MIRNPNQLLLAPENSISLLHYVHYSPTPVQEEFQVGVLMVCGGFWLLVEVQLGVHVLI